jgi:hypothetical protein
MPLLTIGIDEVLLLASFSFSLSIKKKLCLLNLERSNLHSSNSCLVNLCGCGLKKS